MPRPSAFPKSYSLKSKKQIDLLFKRGKTVKAYPLKLVYTIQDQQDEPKAIRILISVSKRRFALAVDRNRLKRQCREAFRLQKTPLETSLAKHNKYMEIAILYIGSQPLDFENIRQSMCKILERINLQMQQ